MNEKMLVIDLGQFNEKAIEIIKSGNLLDEDALKFVVDNIKVSSDIWQKVQRGRTETELRTSVLNDLRHPTADSKYWQIYREANIQFEGVIFAIYEWKENQQDLKIIETEIEELDWQIEELKKGDNFLNKIQIKRKEAEREKRKIMMDKKSLLMMNTKASAMDRVRELKILYKIRDELLPQLQYGIDNPNDHQLISYAQSLTLKILNGERTGWVGSGIADINNLKGVQFSCMKYILQDQNNLNIFMNGLPVEAREYIIKLYNLQLIDKPQENKMFEDK